MITWLGQPVTWLAQEAQKSPEEAAGDAAFEQAQKSSWPPTEGDFQAIGAAAGTAVGAAFGGPAGAVIGSVVGTTVGSFVYGFGEAIAGGLDPGGGGSGPLMLSNARRTVGPASKLAAEKLAKDCGTGFATEIGALQRRGVPINDDGYVTSTVLRSWSNTLKPGGGGPAQLQAQVEAFQRLLFAAVAARVAECETRKQAAASAPKSGGGTAPLLVGAAIAAGVAWWLLA
jgi:hypothetical protein